MILHTKYGSRWWPGWGVWQPFWSVVSPYGPSVGSPVNYFSYFPPEKTVWIWKTECMQWHLFLTEDQV